MLIYFHHYYSLLLLLCFFLIKERKEKKRKTYLSSWARPVRSHFPITFWHSIHSSKNFDLETNAFIQVKDYSRREMSFHFWNFRYAHPVFIINARERKWVGRNFDQSHLKQNKSLLFPLLWGQGVKLDLGLVSAARLHVFVFPGSSETKRKIKDLKEIFACLYIMHIINNRCNIKLRTPPPPPKEIVKQKNVNCKFLSIHETLSSQELAW